MTIRTVILVSLIGILGWTAAAQSSGISAGKAGAHPVVKDKPDPDWPKSIKKKSSLTIVLRCIFRSKATVTNIRFIETRPANPEDYSTDEIGDLVKRAMDAAERIKFMPAMKDGKPVSLWMQLEYNFDSQLQDNSSESSGKKSQPQK
jgi:hypothetical protein